MEEDIAVSFHPEEAETPTGVVPVNMTDEQLTGFGQLGSGP
jgi:hypothetical protein